MKKIIFKATIAALVGLVAVQEANAQDCLILEYRNVLPTGCVPASNEFSGFTFEVWASAAPCYTGTMNDWLAMNVRIDATVGTGNVQSVTNTTNPVSTSSGGGSPAVPGFPPAGSSEIGLTFSREPYQPELVSTPILLGSISVALVTPISSTVTLVSRTATSSTGTFWANVQNPGIRLNTQEPGNIDVVSCLALPVTLINFQVKKEGDKAILNWETASETNSDYFEIEQSVDGKHWYRLGTVQSAGESKVLNRYTFTDLNPVAGENLYRLRMVDNDETFAYSRISSVTFDHIAELGTFPNPAINIVNIQGIDRSKVVKVTFVNIEGKEVLTSGLGSGIDVSSLPAGIYLAKIYTSHGQLNVSKVVVSK